MGAWVHLLLLLLPLLLQHIHCCYLLVMPVWAMFLLLLQPLLLLLQTPLLLQPLLLPPCGAGAGRVSSAATAHSTYTCEAWLHPDIRYYCHC